MSCVKLCYVMECVKLCYAMSCYVIYTGGSSSGGGGRGSSSHETRLHHRSLFVSNATIGPRQPLGAGAVQLGRHEHEQRRLGL